MPSEQEQSVEITQADREAAAGSKADDGSHTAYMMADAILSGRMDGYPLVQAFARHRLATLSNQMDGDKALAEVASDFLTAIHNASPNGEWVRVKHHPNGDWSVNDAYNRVLLAPDKALMPEAAVGESRPISGHPCHGLFASAGDRLTHRHWFENGQVMPTCERCGTPIDREHKETGPVSWVPEKRREIVTLADRHAISNAAMKALGEWLAWPDAGRDGPRDVTVGQTLSFLGGLANKLGYGTTPVKERENAATGDRVGPITSFLSRYSGLEGAREAWAALDALAAATNAGQVEAETWESINQWCDDTFGDATIPQIIARAKEEFVELEEPDANHAIEAADVVICLCRIPGFAEALQTKMAINRKRKWRLTGEGTGYHIPSNGQANGEGK